jgi:hypothetical protein
MAQALRIAEAVIFAADRPVSPQTLATVLPEGVSATMACAALAEAYGGPIDAVDPETLLANPEVCKAWLSIAPYVDIPGQATATADRGAGHGAGSHPSMAGISTVMTESALLRSMKEIMGPGVPSVDAITGSSEKRRLWWTLRLERSCLCLRVRLTSIDRVRHAVPLMVLDLYPPC